MKLFFKNEKKLKHNKDIDKDLHWVVETLKRYKNCLLLNKQELYVIYKPNKHKIIYTKKEIVEFLTEKGFKNITFSVAKDNFYICYVD